MTQDEALKLAFDWYGSGGQDPDEFEKLIKTIAAQPEQEPIGYLSEGGAERLFAKKQAHEQIKNFRLFAHDVPVYAHPPQRTEQEPVAWQFMNGSSFRKRRPDDFSDLASDGLPYWRPLYTHPPQRTWVGLTDEEIKEFDTWHDNREEEVGWCNPSEIVAYIEAKLKEKNT